MLPDEVRRAVEAALGPVRRVSPVGGGCIHEAVRVEVSGGAVFLKHGASAPAGLFSAEARGLEALAAAGSGLRIPEVLALEDAEPGGHGWLALEWLEPSEALSGVWLGSGLAALHRAPADGWGWDRDGFIGELPQENSTLGSWADFWRRRRLEPQLRRADEAGMRPGAAADWDRLLDRLPALLAPAEAEGPSLVHGDLWSGNVLAVGAGEPALVDPAAYHGHREVDLAMSELFGGFPRDFLAAYREAWPLAPGYEEGRRTVYQLFYLLVHVNIFGGGYVPQTAAALRQVLATL